MALRRFRSRVFLLLLLCGTLVFWAIILIDWADNNNVEQDSSLKLHLNSVEKSGGVPGSLRLLFNRLKNDRQRTENTLKNYYNIEKQACMFPRPLSELEKKIVPNQVFFVWCQNRTFKFNDYLSVLSVWKLLEPEKIEIHHEVNITTDNYNQWLQELNRTIPVFFLHVVTHRKESICHNPLYYGLEVLADRGGLFMDFSTVLLRPVHYLRNQKFTIGINHLGDVSFIMSKIKSSEVRRVLEKTDLQKVAQTVSALKKYGSRAELCPSLSSSFPITVLARTRTKMLCVTVPSRLSLKPLDLHKIENYNLTVLRDLYYLEQRKERECSDVPEIQKSIPPIVHYVWFGEEEFSFRMYLSFLSTVHVARVERVYIHCDQSLTGYYWKTVSTHPKVIVVYREIPRRIYGHQILYKQHFSDVVRADVLDKYGGIYLDWDVLWLQSPAPLLTSSHEAIVDLDHMPQPNFPEVLNLGVFLARPRARFVRLWRWELRNYRSREFFYNALELPYKVYESHPDTVHIEERLQVMCFWLKCHPIFHPDHKDWGKAQPFNWRRDVYAIHFTHPDPKEYDSIVSLLNATGTFAQIGKFILEISGELDLN